MSSSEDTNVDVLVSYLFGTDSMPSYLLRCYSFADKKLLKRLQEHWSALGEGRQKEIMGFDQSVVEDHIRLHQDLWGDQEKDFAYRWLEVPRVPDPEEFFNSLYSTMENGIRSRFLELLNGCFTHMMTTTLPVVPSPELIYWFYDLLPMRYPYPRMNLAQTKYRGRGFGPLFEYYSQSEDFSFDKWMTERFYLRYTSYGSSGPFSREYIGLREDKPLPAAFFYEEAMCLFSMKVVTAALDTFLNRLAVDVGASGDVLKVLSRCGRFDPPELRTREAIERALKRKADASVPADVPDLESDDEEYEEDLGSVSSWSLSSSARVGRYDRDPREPSEVNNILYGRYYPRCAAPDGKPDTSYMYDNMYCIDVHEMQRRIQHEMVGVYRRVSTVTQLVTGDSQSQQHVRKRCVLSEELLRTTRPVPRTWSKPISAGCLLPTERSQSSVKECVANVKDSDYDSSDELKQDSHRTKRIKKANNALKEVRKSFVAHHLCSDVRSAIDRHSLSWESPYGLDHYGTVQWLKAMRQSPAGGKELESFHRLRVGEVRETVSFADHRRALNVLRQWTREMQHNTSARFCVDPIQARPTFSGNPFSLTEIYDGQLAVDTDSYNSIHFAYPNLSRRQSDQHGSLIADPVYTGVVNRKPRAIPVVEEIPAVVESTATPAVSDTAATPPAVAEECVADVETSHSAVAEQPAPPLPEETTPTPNDLDAADNDDVGDTSASERVDANRSSCSPESEVKESWEEDVNETDVREFVEAKGGVSPVGDDADVDAEVEINTTSFQTVPEDTDDQDTGAESESVPISPELAPEEPPQPLAENTSAAFAPAEQPASTDTRDTTSFPMAFEAAPPLDPAVIDSYAKPAEVAIDRHRPLPASGDGARVWGGNDRYETGFREAAEVVGDRYGDRAIDRPATERPYLYGLGEPRSNDNAITWERALRAEAADGSSGYVPPWSRSRPTDAGGQSTAAGGGSGGIGVIGGERRAPSGRPERIATGFGTMFGEWDASSARAEPPINANADAMHSHNHGVRSWPGHGDADRQPRTSSHGFTQPSSFHSLDDPRGPGEAATLPAWTGEAGESTRRVRTPVGSGLSVALFPDNIWSPKDAGDHRQPFRPPSVSSHSGRETPPPISAGDQDRDHFRFTDVREPAAYTQFGGGGAGAFGPTTAFVHPREEERERAREHERERVEYMRGLGRGAARPPYDARPPPFDPRDFPRGPGEPAPPYYDRRGDSGGFDRFGGGGYTNSSAYYAASARPFDRTAPHAADNPPGGTAYSSEAYRDPFRHAPPPPRDPPFRDPFGPPYPGRQAPHATRFAGDEYRDAYHDRRDRYARDAAPEYQRYYRAGEPAGPPLRYAGEPPVRRTQY